MRLIAVTPDLHEQHSGLLREMHCLRAKVFGSRLGWEVTTTGDGERDEYDDLRPTYILATKSGAVCGCARLLPAVGPTMLQETFPQLLEAGRLAAHLGMIESSRFCVDTSLGEGREGGHLHLATLSMFAGIIEWSMANGYSEIVTATDLRSERILKRAGWPMLRLGEPVAIGNTMAVAGSLRADASSFERVRPAGYRSSFSGNGTTPARSAA
ncbi:acyl-homoserine-lactone synthase [Rhizobium binae]|uniref:acyl-homoserine-lactone synthase n=1 Tax=Rhizobium binae TaxID=1138190 RepID=UPI001C82888C|nr:acyl-homoserine-lactone synthase TraI [Rhizobium binae]MBX4962612.1 GNAT family N-acetyltransferase [Rhizobium binae]